MGRRTTIARRRREHFRRIALLDAALVLEKARYRKKLQQYSFLIISLIMCAAIPLMTAPEAQYVPTHTRLSAATLGHHFYDVQSMFRLTVDEILGASFIVTICSFLHVAGCVSACCRGFSSASSSRIFHNVKRQSECCGRPLHCVTAACLSFSLDGSGAGIRPSKRFPVPHFFAYHDVTNDDVGPSA